MYAHLLAVWVAHAFDSWSVFADAVAMLNHALRMHLDTPVSLFGLEDLARSMEVTVTLGSLPIGWWGAYHALSRSVTMLPDLHPHQFRSVLAHELGHAHHEHGWSPVGSVHERQADRFAAKQLIRMDDYNRARRRHGADLEAVARELGVMPWVVTEYMSTMSGHLFARSGTGEYHGRPPFNLPSEHPDVVGSDLCQNVTEVTQNDLPDGLILGNGVLL